jgi:hypothetical protein
MKDENVSVPRTPQLRNARRIEGDEDPAHFTHRVDMLLGVAGDPRASSPESTIGQIYRQN